MIISVINHHLMWKMQKPLSTVASRWKSTARERNSSTIAQLREAGETTNATWFLVLKYMTVHDCTIIPSSVPIVVANQQISVSFPGETCFAMLRQAAERERLSSPPMSWSWKKHELLVTIFNSGGYWTIQLFQLPRLHRIIWDLGILFTSD